MILTSIGIIIYAAIFPHKIGYFVRLEGPKYVGRWQCDQKIAKGLLKLPKNDFTRKIKDFDTFSKIA